MLFFNWLGEFEIFFRKRDPGQRMSGVPLYDGGMKNEFGMKNGEGGKGKPHGKHRTSNAQHRTSKRGES